MLNGSWLTPFRSYDLHIYHIFIELNENVFRINEFCETSSGDGSEWIYTNEMRHVHTSCSVHYYDWTGAFINEQSTYIRSHGRNRMANNEQQAEITGIFDKVAPRSGTRWEELVLNKRLFELFK